LSSKTKKEAGFKMAAIFYKTKFYFTFVVGLDGFNNCIRIAIKNSKSNFLIMTSPTDSNIEQFVAKILELQNAGFEKNLQESDLKTIADEMGISEMEWLSLMKIHDDHLTRGIAYLRYENSDDAIRELEQAVAIYPIHAQTLHYLALSYKHRWDKLHYPKDNEQALKYAQLCLEQTPTNEELIQLVSALKRPPKKKRHFKAWQWVAVWGAIIALIGVTIVFFLYKKHTKLADIPDTIIQKEPFVSQATSGKYETVSSNGIPVLLLKNEKSENLELSVQHSTFNKYDKSYSYELKADLIPQGIEITQIKVQVEVVDKDNKVVDTDVKNLLDSYQSPARSGDIMTLCHIQFENNKTVSQLKEVRVSVLYIEKQKSTVTYAPSKKIPTLWEGEKPANYDVEFRERVASVRENGNKSVYQEIVFEAQNIGNSDIKDLKIQIEWHDKSGKVVETKPLYINTSSVVALKRNQTHIVGGTWEVNSTKAELGNYTVKVIDIK
jgi:tetratricopeptide (TPR) repeat protein